MFFAPLFFKKAAYFLGKIALSGVSPFWARWRSK
jgi:hypothetical protein